MLRDKQKNIIRFYELADYYVDKDPIIRGIIRGVYTAFSVSDWKLIGTNEKTKEKYQAYYDRIGLRDRMASIFYQYFKYANVYVYLMEDGSLITLPVHKTRIANIMLNGEPVIEYDVQSIASDVWNNGTEARKDFTDDADLDVRLAGFPPEIIKGVKDGVQWVQLNPDNTFVMQDLKEDWMRYSIPIIAPCLTGLAKKALIENWEATRLNQSMGSFVHVRYGNDKSDRLDLMPNQEELMQVNSVFRRAMQGSALAVTNNYARAEIISPDISDLFEYDKYKNVNSEILSAGGISGIIVSGRVDDGSTFASAQVSMNTADKRIELARRNFCELMNKINRRVNGDMLTRSSSTNVPTFTLLPVDLSGGSKFQKTCMELWQQGCVSTKTMLQNQGFDYDQEVYRKNKEIEDGTYVLMHKDVLNDAVSTEDNDVGDAKVGRPTLSDEERTSDVGKAMTGKQPKPSNPEGSLED